MAEEHQPLSLLGVARRSLGLALLVTAGTLGLGKLLGWSFLRAYQRVDMALFLGGSLLFCMGVFRGKPAPPPRPRGDTAAPAPPASAEAAGEEEDPEALTPSEEAALRRSRERAPALATAGLVLILSTQLLYWSRDLLGQLYGR